MAPGDHPLYTIGELAAASGVSVETVRFYEREKLVEQPSKPSRGYRRYSAETLRQLEFIRRAKLVGFTLDEIRELLALRARRGGPCKSVRERALAKRDAIDSKIVELQQLRRAVEELVSVCTGAVAIEQCSIIGALDGLAEMPEVKRNKKAARGEEPS